MENILAEAESLYDAAAKLLADPETRQIFLAAVSAIVSLVTFAGAKLGWRVACGSVKRAGRWFRGWQPGELAAEVLTAIRGRDAEVIGHHRDLLATPSCSVTLKPTFYLNAGNKETPSNGWSRPVGSPPHPPGTIMANGQRLNDHLTAREQKFILREALRIAAEIDRAHDAVAKQRLVWHLRTKSAEDFSAVAIERELDEALLKRYEA